MSDITILSRSALGGRSGPYFLGWPITANTIIWREPFVTPKGLYRPWLQAQPIVSSQDLNFFLVFSAQDHLLQWKQLPCSGGGLAWPITRAFIKLLVHAMYRAVTQRSTVNIAVVSENSLPSDQKGQASQWVMPEGCCCELLSRELAVGCS